MDERPRPGCPKRMVYGPCGGVRPDGGCETDGHQCVFVDPPLTPWPDPVAASAPTGPLGTRSPGQPFVVTDIALRPQNLDSLHRAARVLQGTCDAVLVGDHGSRHDDFPPSFIAAALTAAGIKPWVTLSCRDRNRVALASELAALAQLDVAGVHCVTGDWQLGADERSTMVFDLDALRLVDLARNRGLTVSVAAAPAAPPTDLRAARLAQKVRAGAQVCFINHAGGPGPVGRFVTAAHDLGVDIPFIACIPVVSDPASLRLLATLPGLVLDDEVLRPPDPGTDQRTHGITVAAARAAAMVAIPGVIGVNLSGAASTVSDVDSTAMMAELGTRVRTLPGP